jgi:hypothetical protein
VCRLYVKLSVSRPDRFVETLPPHRCRPEHIAAPRRVQRNAIPADHNNIDIILLSGQRNYILLPSRDFPGAGATSHLGPSAVLIMTAGVARFRLQGAIGFAGASPVFMSTAARTMVRDSPWSEGWPPAPPNGDRPTYRTNAAADQRTRGGPAAGYRRDSSTCTGAHKSTGHCASSRAAAAARQSQHHTKQQNAEQPHD